MSATDQSLVVKVLKKAVGLPSLPTGSASCGCGSAAASTGEEAKAADRPSGDKGSGGKDAAREEVEQPEEG